MVVKVPIKKPSINVPIKKPATGGSTVVPKPPTSNPVTPTNTQKPSISLGSGIKDALGIGSGSSNSSSSVGSYNNNSSSFDLNKYNQLSGQIGGVKDKINSAQNQFGLNLAPQAPYKPGQAAKNTASFNGSNWNDKSGVYVDGVQQTHGQATGLNPLHVVNANREQLIQNSIKNNDWTDYQNWSAKQTPMYFEQDANGNSQYNKNYYANSLESTLRAINEAKAQGDTFTAGEWQRSLNETLEKYKNAPGADQYIVGINNNLANSQEYGVAQVGSDWFNSQWNNPNVRSQGYANDRYWTENPVFEDKNLLTQALNLSNNYGSADEQEQRQSINNQAMQAYLNNMNGGNNQASMYGNTGQTSQYDALIQQQQAELDALNKKLADLEKENAYKESEISGVTGGTSGVISGSDNLQHIYSPGGSANTGGYTENQLITNDAFNRYLKNIFTGGF